MAIEESTRHGQDHRVQPSDACDLLNHPPTGPDTIAGHCDRAVLDGLPPQWKTLHARHWPGRSYDVVDHLVVGPTGIFIVDSVRWSGGVTITADTLTVNGRSRLAAVQTAYETAREVALLLSPDLRDHIYPVICFTRDEPIFGWVKAVRVCSTTSLRDLIEARDPVVSADAVARIVSDLEVALPPSRAAIAAHLRASDLVSADRRTDADAHGADARAARWYRSPAGRLTVAALGLVSIVGLTAIGLHLAAAHPVPDLVPSQGAVSPTTSP